jgi:hypothetical protein
VGRALLYSIIGTCKLLRVGGRQALGGINGKALVLDIGESDAMML